MMHVGKSKMGNIVAMLGNRLSGRKLSSLPDIRAAPGEDAVCIDCGANVGNVTEQMCANGFEVYAFEPNPFAFKVLKDRFAENPRVHVLNKGVWDRNDTMRLYLHEHSDEDEVFWSTGSSLLEYKGNVRKDKFVDVKVIDLSEFIENLHRPVKILKMDIEGCECEVLSELIDGGGYKNIGHIFAETHDHKIPELREKTDALRRKIRRKHIRNINLDWI